MIANFFIPELNNHDVQELWFQQDGATCHTARATIDLLKDTFGDRLISRFGPVNRPPRSCDSTPLDYFVWGYVKSLVYADRPQTLDQLEDNIRSVIADIRPQMVEKVIENWTSRLEYIRASRGIHLPEIIFKMTTKKNIFLREDRLFLSNRKFNSSQILKQWNLTSNVSVCQRTVRGRLLESGLRGCKARPKTLLTEFQRKRRLTWAREHSLWTIKDWEKVIFSDESQFCISGNQSSAYGSRRTHEEFSPQCLKPTVKYPTKVMVWGCMSSHGVGRLHIVSGTVKAMDYVEILQNKLLPTARDLLGNHSCIFQDDNTPCHRTKVVQKWLEDHIVNRMNWTGQSLDLNPIESLWFKIGYEISKKKPSNKRELIEALIFSFYHIVTKDFLLKLVHSMPIRCRAVIKANGWPIKY
ncbi:transposable element Tcb1 transposase [Trichonephila clavipes]|nr:transposable element Tcb1 transposase [Trichonephila clavipes]